MASPREPQASFKEEEQEQQPALDKQYATLKVRYESRDALDNPCIAATCSGKCSCHDQENRSPAKQHLTEIDEGGVRLEGVNEDLIHHRKLQQQLQEVQHPPDIGIVRSQDSGRVSQVEALQESHRRAAEYQVRKEYRETGFELAALEDRQNSDLNKNANSR